MFIRLSKSYLVSAQQVSGLLGYTEKKIKIPLVMEGTGKKQVMKYITKVVRLLVSALSDIKQGHVIETSKGEEPFSRNG